jgi:hypothetical protein
MAEENLYLELQLACGVTLPSNPLDQPCPSKQRVLEVQQALQQSHIVLPAGKLEQCSPAYS